MTKLSSFSETYNNITNAFKRAESLPHIRLSKFPSTVIPNIEKYICFKSEKEIPLVGSVAAEGDVIFYNDEDNVVEKKKWPEFLCGRVLYDYGNPVVLAGQTGLFTEKRPAKSGDIALVYCSGKTYLRRIFEANIAGEPAPGWVAQILNTNMRDIPPIFARHDDKTLPLVGVLYTREFGSGTINPSGESELEPLETKTDVMRKMAAGNIKLVQVTGSSAEPVGDIVKCCGFEGKSISTFVQHQAASFSIPSMKTTPPNSLRISA